MDWFSRSGYAVHYRYKKLFNNNNYLSSYFKDKSVISLSADKHQNLWIATLMDGVFVYRFGNQQLEKIDRNELLAEVKGILLMSISCMSAI